MRLTARAHAKTLEQVDIRGFFWFKYYLWPTADGAHMKLRGPGLMHNVEGRTPQEDWAQCACNVEIKVLRAPVNCVAYGTVKVLPPSGWCVHVWSI